MNALTHLTTSALRTAQGVGTSVAAADALSSYCQASCAVLGSQIGIYQGSFSSTR